jgi:DNA-directed RNA polymerase specialized sigma24 family protein
MAFMREKAAGTPATSPRFETTHWSVVLAADTSGSPEADEALRRLCETYWSPVYCFVRRAGNPPNDAQDLTQEFFRRLLAKDFFALADPARGRFRNFLLASLKNFLHKAWRDEHRLERGGDVVFVALDAAANEGLYASEPVDHASPDRLYERRYGLALLEQVLDRLRTDYERSGRGRIFEQLQQFLWGRDAAISY